MHGYSSASALLVNTEVDSMGVFVGSGGGIGVKTSPRGVAIEKTQVTIRQDYVIREARRRELVFLQKGGNPLDFKLGNAACVSIQSSSFTNQPAEHTAKSDAKDSLALTASSRGDSVESSGRPEAKVVIEPNISDNLLLFNGENELVQGERKMKHLGGRNNVAPAEKASQMDVKPFAKEVEDSAIFRPYSKRDRSRLNCNVVRSSFTDKVQNSNGQGFSDVKKLLLHSNNQKNYNSTSTQSPKLATSNGDIVSPRNQPISKMEVVQSVEVTSKQGRVRVSAGRLTIRESISLKDNQKDHPEEVDPKHVPSNMASEDLDAVREQGRVTATVPARPPSAAKYDLKTGSLQMIELGDMEISTQNEEQNSHTSIRLEVFDSGSYCAQNSQNVEVNNENGICINRRIVDESEICQDQRLGFVAAQNSCDGAIIRGKSDSVVVETSGFMKDNCGFLYKDKAVNNTVIKDRREFHTSKPDMKNEAKHPAIVETTQKLGHIVSETDANADKLLGDESNLSTDSGVKLVSAVGCSFHELPKTTLIGGTVPEVSDFQTCSNTDVKFAHKAREDSILEEAEMIKAKRTRIAELSTGTFTSDIQQNSQWDFVLEEMAWLANDFAQERLWKMTVASQVCRQVAYTSRIRSQEHDQYWKLKKIAHTIAKSVLQFWHSAETHLKCDGPKNCKLDSSVSRTAFVDEASTYKSAELDKKTSKESELQPSRKNRILAVQKYAIRFLKYSTFHVPSIEAEAPATPDRISDLGIIDMSWKDQLTEEILFYAVPSGAMEDYRKSIESHVMQHKKTGSCLQVEVGTSIYDPAADFEYFGSAHDDEHEGEASAYYLPGALQKRKSSDYQKKKRKYIMKSYNTSSNEGSGVFPYQYNAAGSQYTASRQRVLCHSGAGATRVLHAPMKANASSGDTSSFEHDQSTLHGGSHTRRSLKVESAGNSEKQLTYDYYSETSTEPMMKKGKHRSSGHEHGRQLDSSAHNEQTGLSRKRMESHLMDEDGFLYEQPNAKKPKVMKRLLNSSFDNITPTAGSIPLPVPVASQLSNVSNPNKFIKLTSGRRGRKAKTLKMSARQPDSGSPWSLSEDQTLIVLVHDMGPNWELVGDAINDSFQFKCIFRTPKECKERYNILLMDCSTRDGGHGANSAEVYPCILPGIPKGSARQLFQRLQGSMEEETIKSHFKTIIGFWKYRHHQRSQNGNLGAQQIAVPDNTHVISLSLVEPNNLNGVVLTPVELSDLPSADTLSRGHQNCHHSVVPILSQGVGTSMLRTFGANSASQESCTVGLSCHLSSPSDQQNVSASARDSRYSVPLTSLTVDEQPTMLYNHTLAGRDMQQLQLLVSMGLTGTDSEVLLMAQGNRMGMMNRSMPMPRSEFQEMTSASMLNSGSVLASDSVNLQSGDASGQANSILRQRNFFVIQPDHDRDDRRQMISPDMHISLGNTGLNGSSFSYSNQLAPVQTYPLYPQDQHHLSTHHCHIQGTNHPTTLQQQANAFCFTKERQMQQQLLQHHQQQHAVFSGLGHPLSHIQLRNPNQSSSSMTPMTLPHQAGRHHPQQRPNGHLIQGQGLYSGSKLLGPQSPNHLPSHQKMFSCPASPASRPVNQMPSRSDCCSQGQTEMIIANWNTLG